MGINDLAPNNKVVIRGTTVYGLNDKASLIIPIAVIQHDKRILMDALIDSGAQGNFIDTSLAHLFDTEPLLNPITVYNVDGTKNQGGTIHEETMLKIMLDDHPFYVKAYVANLGHQKFILGDTWLRDVNPTIDWARRSISFERQILPKRHAAKEAL